MYRVARFLLGIALSLGIYLSQSNLIGVAKSISGEVREQAQATALTDKGHEQLHRGQAASALETWQAAGKIYHHLNNQEGITGSYINQSLALQALGMYPRACKTLVQALQLEEWICQNQFEQQAIQEPEDIEQRIADAMGRTTLVPVTVSALHNLGDVLRLLGKAEESEIILQQSKSAAKRLKLNTEDRDISLSLANTEHSLYSKFKNRYQLTEEPIAKQKALQTAQAKAELALSLYQQATNSANDTQDWDINVQSRLNSLSLLLELEQLPAQWQRKSQVAHIELLLKQISAKDFSLLPAISSIYARLNFANSLSQAARQKIIPAADFSVLNSALFYSQEGLKIAKQLKDKRAESYAWGRLGKIYSQNQQLRLSRQCFEAALAASSSIQAGDISYQWQQELGEIYQQSGKLEEATKAYEAAVGNLEQVRGNILATNPEIQFSFKEKVEPVYKKYLQLLLLANKPDLKQIIKINEQLQIAELENFLQCGQLDVISLDKLPDINESLAVIYIIDVGGRLEEIIRSGDGSLHRHSPNTEIVKSNAENVLGNFQDERFDYPAQSAIVEYSQALYKQLIVPVQEYLPSSGNLVFVLDSSLQSLPMSLLHDGKEYLIQKYSISTTINSQLRAPKALKPEQMRALIAGLSKKSPSFNDIDALKNLPPLAQVEIEMADVKLSTASAVELVNEEFISENFYREIEQTNFSIIHVTSHGQFSSDPEQTAILAWDKPINIREFNNIVRKASASSPSGIELLVLSACQTAKGDKRSTLGIAGIATTAGARSTLASLWLVEEASTAQLMGKFYEGLKNGLSKAEALQQAQLALLANPEYAHPYYWSSFILVGSWL